MLVLYSIGSLQLQINLGQASFATGGIALVYLIAFIFQLFGYNVPYIHEGGLMGIGFSFVVIAIAGTKPASGFRQF